MELSRFQSTIIEQYFKCLEMRGSPHTIGWCLYCDGIRRRLVRLCYHLVGN